MKSGDELLLKLALRNAVINSVEILRPLLPRSDYHDSKSGEIGGSRLQALEILATMDEVGQDVSMKLGHSFWGWRYKAFNEVPTFWGGN